MEHARICPIRDEIFIAPRGRVWHLRPDCNVLVNQAPGERVYQWCTTCAATSITPNRIHPNTRRTLADDIGMVPEGLALFTVLPLLIVNYTPCNQVSMSGPSEPQKHRRSPQERWAATREHWLRKGSTSRATRHTHNRNLERPHFLLP